MTTEKLEIKAIPLNDELKAIRARHKLAIPSSDTGTYYKDNPSIRPDTATSTVTIPELEEIFWTNPVVNKAIVLKANRIIGEGFELLPSDDANVSQEIAENAVKDCWRFLKKIDYITFFRQAIINAKVAGNEWTELVYTRSEPKSLLYLNHGDFRTIDFRRNFLNNKIVVNNDGEPAGYWQYIENLSELYTSISLLFGSKENYENLQHAKERLLETQQYTVKDEMGNDIAVIMKKPNYMFLNKDEIAHLSFNNLNDNFYGTSDILPAYNAIKHLEQVMYAVAEAINDMGYPKPIIYVGDEQHPPNDVLNSQAEDAVTDPVRKESFVLPYFMKLEYLSPNTANAGTITSYPDWFLTAAAMGLRVPKELLVSEGESNRATSIQASSDFEKDIESDRRVFEEYVYNILSRYLTTRGYMSTNDERNTYTPKIKWNPLIQEDTALKEKMVLEKWNAGLLTYNETRQALGLNEVEEVKLGDAHNFELNKQQQQPQQEVNALINKAAQAESKEPGVPQEAVMTAEFKLQKKSILNKRMNSAFGTEGVDYHKIIYGLGKKIDSVGKTKWRKIRDSMVRSTIAGKTIGRTINAAKRGSGLKESEIKRIVKTEGAALEQAALNEDASNKGMKYKKWVAVIDEKTSPLCKALHGKTARINGYFEADYTDEAGNKQHWRGKIPPGHPNCRSKLEFMEKR